jgi:hypothetical protein
MMALAGLSLKQTPPLSAPLRFFLTAPLFAFLAALLLLFSGPTALASRWSPALLAITHLLTLGFITMSMMAALLQMLPVLAGTPAKQPRLVAWLVHVPLSVGTLLLASGLAAGWKIAMLASLPLLAWAVLTFILVAAYSLARTAARTATINAMRLALGALAVTALLGVTLVAILTGDAALSALKLTDLHAAWGLLGWVGVLIIGVAYQVVPMFQMTPVYATRITAWLTPWLLIMLLIWSFTVWWAEDNAKWVALTGLAPGLASFALATLSLQRKRRRRAPDITLLFWRLGMASLLTASGIWLVAQFSLALSAAAFYPLWLGMLWIVGFAMSVINGMLYKIVPFLVWLHLQSRRPARGTIPNTKEIIPDKMARRQLWVHAAALALLLCAALLPNPLVYLAAIAWCASSALLAWNVFSAYRLYRRLAA